MIKVHQFKLRFYMYSIVTSNMYLEILHVSIFGTIQLLTIGVSIPIF